MSRPRIVGTESPLRRIPSQLDHRQRLFVDGIRYSIEMADLAHERLCVMALCVDGDGRLPQGVEFAHAFLDAWSIVDSLHRLRQLVDGMPYMKRTPPKDLFLRATADVENLRHAVQHLAGEFKKDSDEDDLPWGSLCWVSGPHEGVLKIRLMIAGAQTYTELNFVNPVGRDFSPPVDHFVLDAHGHRVDLSAKMRSVRKFAASFEEAWEKETTGVLETRPADVLLTLDLAV